MPIVTTSMPAFASAGAKAGGPSKVYVFSVFGVPSVEVTPSRFTQAASPFCSAGAMPASTASAPLAFA